MKTHGFVSRTIAFVVGIAILALFSYLISGCKLDPAFAQTFGALATPAAAIAAIVTLWKMQQSNDFSVVVSVHARLNEDTSYLCRRYIHMSFGDDLVDVAQKVFGADSVAAGRVNVQWIVANLAKDGKREQEFNRELDAKSSLIPGVSALTAAERVLLDFDLIALPFFLGNPSARIAALAWKSVLDETSTKLLPLVAIKAKLRGKSYKFHYLKLLSDLGIDLMGVQVPPAP